MRKRAWTYAAAAVLAVVAASALSARLPLREAAAGEDLSPTKEEAAFYAWWDAIGFPNLAETAFVRFSDEGRPRPRAGQSMGFEHGFLVSEGGSSVVVFTTDLRYLRLKNSSEPIPGRRAAAYEPADLGRFVRLGLAGIEAAGSDAHQSDTPDAFGAHRWAWPDHSFRIAVLARACAARGLPDLAHRLCRLALGDAMPALRAAPHEPTESEERDGFALLRASLSEEASVALDERFGDRETPWASLALQMRRFGKGLRWDVKGPLSVLDAMAADQVARSREPRKAWAEMTTDERVADAISRLPDAYEMVSNFEYGVLPPARAAGEPRDPIYDLLEIGRPAVPRLIDAMTDSRPTRSVWTLFTSGKAQYRDAIFVSSAGDVARSILRRLGEDVGIEMEFPGWADAVEPSFTESLRAAWAKAGPVNEADVARNVVVQAGAGARFQLRRLAALDPARALAAACEGLNAAEHPHGIASLLAEIADLPGEAALPLLFGRLSMEWPLEVRLAAAQGLAKLGRPEGVAAMATAWRNLRDTTDPASAAGRDKVLSFLAASGDGGGVAALAEGLGGRPADSRRRVVLAFLPGLESRRPPRDAAPQSADVEWSIETLLGGRLSDSDAAPAENWTSAAKQGLELRVAHAAAQALAARFPTRYRYDSDAPLAARDRMHAQLRNDYRVGRGFAPVPLDPAQPRVAAISIDRVRPLVDRMAAAVDAAARSAILAEIAALGVGAVPALLDPDATLAPGHPMRRVALDLAARLGSIVTEVRHADGRSTPDPSLRAFVEGLKGMALTGALFVEIFQTVAKSPRATGRGVRVRAERIDVGEGLRLTVTVSDGVSGPDGASGGWQVSGLDVRAGRWGHGTSHSWASDGSPAEASFWGSVRFDVDMALSESPDLAFHAEDSIVHE